MWCPRSGGIYHPVSQPVADALTFVLIVVDRPRPLTFITGKPALPYRAGVDRVLGREDKPAARLQRLIDGGKYRSEVGQVVQSQLAVYQIDFLARQCELFKNTALVADAVVIG